MTITYFWPRKHLTWLMVGLTLAGTVVRLWLFPNIPPGFVYDEAYKAVDARWLWQADSLFVFLPGNNGQPTLFQYLAGLFMIMFGHRIFVYRLTAVMIGIATIPLMFRWVATMFNEEPDHHYLGLLAGAGVAFSFWHLVVSRAGLRASFVPFFFVLTAYLFWRGWQRQSGWSIAGAGLALGLSQYTYWPAVVLLPLPFGVFGLFWTISKLRKLPALQPYSTYTLPKVWGWIGLMALISLVVFIPLGLVLVNHPLFIEYIYHASAAHQQATSQPIAWYTHLLDSIRILIDGPVALWQGQFSQSLGFDWLAFIGFWAGLIIAARRWRQPAYLFLLVSLIALWLPAPLGDMDFSDLRLPDMVPAHQAIGVLRLVGMLPAYYALAAVGWFAGLKWLGQRLSWFHKKPAVTGLTGFVLIVVVSGGFNMYSFFWRWPRQPALYGRYNGPILDLTQDIIRESYSQDILLPFKLYAQPTMHFFLDGDFVESETPPPLVSNRPAMLVTTSDGAPSAYMWLSRSETGAGLAYLCPTQNTSDLLQAASGEVIRSYDIAAPLLVTAQSTLIPNLQGLRTALTAWPNLDRLNYIWDHEESLVGYQISPAWTQAGESLGLTLYWRNLVDQPIVHDVFIHAINKDGQGVGQVDGVTLTDGHRWRGGKITPTYHTLQLGRQLEPGPYLFRLGLFNAWSGARIPVLSDRGETIGDQALFGLFYITTDKQNPIQPATPVEAVLDGRIRLLGYTLLSSSTDTLALQPQAETTLPLKLYWRADQPVAGDYTIFTQLLTAQNQYVAGYDSQPLNGNYPSSLWQPGEVIVEEVNLVLPAQIAGGEYHLVTGMYEPATGQRLAATDHRGQPAPDNMVIFAQAQVSSGQITLQVSPQARPGSTQP